MLWALYRELTLCLRFHVALTSNNYYRAQVNEKILTSKTLINKLVTILYIRVCHSQEVQYWTLATPAAIYLRVSWPQNPKYIRESCHGRVFCEKFYSVYVVKGFEACSFANTHSGSWWICQKSKALLRLETDCFFFVFEIFIMIKTSKLDIHHTPSVTVSLISSRPTLAS